VFTHTRRHRTMRRSFTIRTSPPQQHAIRRENISRIPYAVHGRTSVGGDNHNVRVMHAGHWGPRGLIYQSIHDRLLPPVPTPLNVLQHRSDSRRWPGGEGGLRNIIYTTISQDPRLSGHPVYRSIYMATSHASAYGRYSHRFTTPNALLRRMLLAGVAGSRLGETEFDGWTSPE
jgi:hypothetical protein